MAEATPEKALFIGKGGVKVKASDFVQALRDLGVQPGDQLFVHTQMFSFGKLNWRAKIGKEELCESIIGAFQEVVGPEGTLMMTTFTSNVHLTGLYDVEETPSEGGALTEYFRKMPGVKRSAHPTHSFAIWGRDQEFFLSEAKSTFGRDSIYGKLWQRNTWLIDWGTIFKSTTFLHFVEDEAKLPYRREYKLEVRVKEAGQEYKRWIYKYRKSTRLSVDYRAFAKDLKSLGLLKGVSVGDGEIMASRAKDVWEEGLKALKKDKYYFVSVEPFWPYYKRQIKMMVKSLLGRK